MNRIIKTTASVLRIYPYSRSSNIVDWLLRDGRRMTTVIKGACRPKSAFLGQYDLFYTCELLYYSRENDGLHIARECWPLKARDGFRSNWRATACAGYLGDLICRAIFRSTPHAALFMQYNQCLDALAKRTQAAQILAWMELQVLNHVGLRPHFSRCASCGAAPQPGMAHGAFSVAAGGVICRNCSTQGGAALKMLPGLSRMLHSWQQAPEVRSAVNTICSKQQILAFQKILGRFIEYHLDVGGYGRRVALAAVGAADTKES